jgi:hypothetical protein
MLHASAHSAILLQYVAFIQRRLQGSVHQWDTYLRVLQTITARILPCDSFSQKAVS